MSKREKEFIFQVSFAEQTPEMLIEQEKLNPKYEEAFLKREEETDNEFKKNTTTWD